MNAREALRSIRTQLQQTKSQLQQEFARNWSQRAVEEELQFEEADEWVADCCCRRRVNEYLRRFTPSEPQHASYRFILRSRLAVGCNDPRKVAQYLADHRELTEA